MAYLSISNVGQTSVDWSVGGLGSLWDSDSYEYIVLCTGTTTEGSTTPPDGIVDYRYPPTPPGSEYGFSGETCYGLSPGTSYNFRAYALVTSGKWYAAGSSVYVTTDMPRPSNWSWWYSKVSGGSFNLTASEWNSFTDRINQFRAYKNIGNYGFTSAFTGNQIYAYMYNQAIYAIDSMNPPTSTPSTVSPGDNITAYGFNRLRDSLNSIS
jgi:hypothetical protein